MKLDNLKKKNAEDDETTRFVRNALEHKLNGSVESYNVIKGILLCSPNTDAIMDMMRGLNHCINLLSNNMNIFFDLITSVMSISFKNNFDMATVLCDFCISLSSISSTCYNVIFDMLIREIMALTPTEEVMKATDETSRAKFLDLCHNSIQTILKVAPISGDVLISSYKHNYPYITKETVYHIHAVENLLRILSYAPVLRERGLTVIVEQLIAIDVEIPLDDNEEVLSKEVATESLSDKLDKLLLLVFQYIEKESKEEESSLAIFKILQKVFEQSIMLTHRSKYTQFLLFYVCHYNQSYVERFVGRLVDWFCSEEAPTITRQTCASYCASFICRANFISIDIIRSVLFFLLTWIIKYIDIYDEQTKPLNPGDPGHLVFYSLNQSVCYILCFTSKRFEQEEKGISFLRSWDWTKIINSPLDPLRYCISSIAQEFISVTQRLDLLNVPAINSDFVQYLISSIKPEDNDVTKRENEIGSGYNPLDSFFPFDPYLLQNSNQFIEPLYITWNSIVDEDSEESESEEYSVSDSLSSSSLSMSIESHSSYSSQNQSLSDANKMSGKPRKLSISAVYEDNIAESTEAKPYDSNPLSSADVEEDFKSLSFTRIRKMSDAGGW